MAKCQPEEFWSWMVPTDTLNRGGYMGGRCVALTWSSVADGRPDWPSDHMSAPWPDVRYECSSLSTHCTKVRGSTSAGTGFPHSFTRPSVQAHRGSHPARSGRPRGAHHPRVTWFRSYTYYLGSSEIIFCYAELRSCSYCSMPKGRFGAVLAAVCVWAWWATPRHFLCL